MESGWFITLEGGEGAGKSTQIPRIREWLEQAGHDVCVTRQPGGTPLAEKIRGLVLENVHGQVTALTELLLLFAARAQFMEEVVAPALARGQTVLCDRFTDSTRAYQGGGRNMSVEAIESLAELVHGDHHPDMTLLFDLPVAQGMQRAANRSEADRLELAGEAFHERVRKRYLELAQNEPERFEVIDASVDPDAVWEQVRRCLQARLAP